MSRKLAHIVALALVLGCILLSGTAFAASASNPATRDQANTSVTQTRAGGVQVFSLDDQDPGGNHPPDGFSRLLPGDYAVVPRNSVRFQWHASGDPDGDPITYELQWCIEGVAYQPVQLTDTTSLQDFSNPDLPLERLTVVWHVYARDNHSHSVEAYNGAGMFYLDVASGTDVEAVAQPRAYSLANYPNPFNPSTSLSFHLAQAGTVELRVFDLLGRQVWSALPGFLPAGDHRLEFDGSSLPSGTYIVRLSGEKAEVTHRMILMK